MAEVKACPHCGADLTRALPDGGTGTRTIGVQIWGVYDGVLFWRCPDCGGSWHRWTPADWLRMHEAAARYVGPPEKTAAELDVWAERMGLAPRTKERP